MKTILFSMGVAVALSGCASAPQLAWGKPGVSKVDYGTDVGMCSGLAAMQNTGNGANSAGGVDGKAIANTSNPAPVMTPPPTAGSGQTTHVDAPLPAAGSYSGVASADYAQRAATQQSSQEMAAKRARAHALRSCLAERGYSEITLTRQQAAHLATLKKGTNEYHEYLYTLGSDPGVVASQSAPPR